MEDLLRRPSREASQGRWESACRSSPDTQLGPYWNPVKTSHSLHLDFTPDLQTVCVALPVLGGGVFMWGVSIHPTHCLTGQMDT